jgi:hypothetical protein
MIAPDRHNRGWPRYTLHITTSQSDQTYRWHITAFGGLDGHDARGNTWEIIKWIRKVTTHYKKAS